MNFIKSILNYLQNHKYATAFGLILAILGIIWSIITWWFPQNIVLNRKDENSKILQGSIYELPKIVSSGKTTLENQELMKEYVGLSVKDKGYIIDISRESSYITNESYLIADIVSTTTKKSSYIVSGVNNSSYISPVIKCRFPENWIKILKTIDLSKEIDFTGEIIDNSGNFEMTTVGILYTSQIILKNCTLF